MHITRRHVTARTLLCALVVLVLGALVVPAAVAQAEQIVIPIDDPAVPWEFDDPCTGEAVHGLAHETGSVHITDLGDQGFHVRLRVDGVVDLFDADDNLVGTWTYRLVFTDQFPPGGQGAVHFSSSGPLRYVDGRTVILHVNHHHVFAKGDIEKKPERNTAVCGGTKS